MQKLSTVCKDGQLILLGGRLEKAAFSGGIDRFILQDWVRFTRCTLQDNGRRGTEKAYRLSRQAHHRRAVPSNL